MRRATINSYTRPHVLVLSGLDPSGGAGIQADIQAITSLGGHPLPVLTCLTVQDTNNVYGAEPVNAELIRQQLQCLAADVPIHAIKTGALGNADVVDVLVEFLDSQPELPLIVDPVIKAAGGGDLADEALVQAMKTRLFPRAEMITPNGVELAQLGGSDDPDQAARNLIDAGCQSVLATGGHGTGIHIVNTLYNHAPEPMHWEVERVGANEFHGTGCTLAAAIAAGRASGLSARASISQAQNYVHRALLHALNVGKGQRVPDRGILWER
ncbi:MULTISPECIES: bifunctional hydroxymethylpyrimidine kinase/phosphomethylpyrimidine kinase [Marinobacter]|uniref:hydroxymethylpyrimidine kinase n=1 Tax=Marinobacter alkaliphilus TaxID=254719 RepID=A0ABZ3E464_9GAMM|nr:MULTISPECIES: bifunctional hydroxymethylpyrimidine kinase/phosphomethylpyrimidine kinase [unclassified Marinobacter]QFS85717.1 Hydroxymethylpyrimidine/phosphomethylpyrimidine kinase [Marinobacter sp. THAF197a]QFT49511.1 Hydroxymethylpyrimidine/phosphomethylpyrimidine kinase [Marinobacter sp. THAF39]